MDAVATTHDALTHEVDNRHCDTTEGETVMAYPRPVLLILLATSACTDLSAVRDYAKTASAVTENATIFRQWPTAYDTSLSLSGAPHVRSVYPQLHEQIRKEDAYAVGRSETAILATQAL